jgi:hypothetical protein
MLRKGRKKYELSFFHKRLITLLNVEWLNAKWLTVKWLSVCRIWLNEEWQSTFSHSTFSHSTSSHSTSFLQSANGAGTIRPRTLFSDVFRPRTLFSDVFTSLRVIFRRFYVPARYFPTFLRPHMFHPWMSHNQQNSTNHRFAGHLA